MISMLEEKLDTMNEHVGEQPWEEDLAALLNDLSQVQDDLLDVLARKRQCMAVADIRGLLRDRFAVAIEGRLAFSLPDLVP
mgnify:CR=1 FL=1